MHRTTMLGVVTRLAVTLGVLALVIGGCSPKLEEGDLLEKNGDTFTIRLTKQIDQPIDKVWQGFQTPERLEKYSEQYQQTKLVKDEGNTKIVDYRVSTLGQVQAFTMQLTMDPATKVVKLKTLESSLVDIDGSYELRPSADGKGTMITYKAVQKDKVNLPAPVSVQKTAIKEAFDNLVAGIDKGIKSGDTGSPKAS